MKGKPKQGFKTPVPKMTLREVAELLGVSHGTVKNIEREALRKLRAGLAGWQP
jgi:DNA-directed RNA polymerase sigma subunit (sigma70/sigma32)